MIMRRTFVACSLAPSLKVHEGPLRLWGVKWRCDLVGIFWVFWKLSKKIGFWKSNAKWKFLNSKIFFGTPSQVDLGVNLNNISGLRLAVQIKEEKYCYFFLFFFWSILTFLLQKFFPSSITDQKYHFQRRLELDSDRLVTEFMEMSKPSQAVSLDLTTSTDSLVIEGNPNGGSKKKQDQSKLMALQKTSKDFDCSIHLGEKEWPPEEIMKRTISENTHMKGPRENLTRHSEPARIWRTWIPEPERTGNWSTYSPRNSLRSRMLKYEQEYHHWESPLLEWDLCWSKDTQP